MRRSGAMARPQAKPIGVPGEVRSMPRGTLEIYTIDDHVADEA